MSFLRLEAAWNMAIERVSRRVLNAVQWGLLVLNVGVCDQRGRMMEPWSWPGGWGWLSFTVGGERVGEVRRKILIASKTCSKKGWRWASGRKIYCLIVRGAMTVVLARVGLRGIEF